jgi:hypothetical protein
METGRKKAVDRGTKKRYLLGALAALSPGRGGMV